MKWTLGLALMSLLFAENKTPDPFAVNAKLGRGMNLGNHFEPPRWGDWGQIYQGDEFQTMKMFGFSHVRIPVRWDAYTDKNPPYQIIPDSLARVVKVVRDARDAGLMVILNQHHHEPIYHHPQEELPRFLAIWDQVATALKEEGDYLLFELLNEPKENLDAEKWNAMFPKIIEVLRKTNPHRTLVIGGHNWNSIRGLKSLKLPKEEKNFIATFHFYDPFQFTHQGAEWVEDSDPWLGTKWRGSKSQQNEITAALQSAADWSKTNKVPVYLGEFGAYSKADDSSRVLWTEFVQTKSLELGIPWAYWEWSSGFGVWDKKRNIASNTNLLNSLLMTRVDWANYPAVPDLADISGFVFDDFEDAYGDAPNTPAFAAAAAKEQKKDLNQGTSHWYIYKDEGSNWYSPQGEKIAVFKEIKEGAKDNTFSLFSKNGKEGNGFEATLHLKGNSYPWGGLGINLHAECQDCFLDLRDLQVISFWGKGNGSIRMKLATKAAEEIKDNWGSFDAVIQLTPEWQRFIIPIQEFRPSPYSALQAQKVEIKDALKAVRALEFMGPQFATPEQDLKIDIAIDNVMFHGIDRKVLTTK